MQNSLAQETSPYLLQHAGNPVHWQPWGQNALDEARRLNKPILLSVGYAACHWCHVMAHESFEDPRIAALMNELFINIKVDREERPDIDQIYMSALHALGEQGGWPLTMFLTPDGDPFWGGTYFPPEPRYGRPGFPDMLRAIANAYHTDPVRVGRNRDALRDVLARIDPPGTQALGGDELSQAIVRLAGITDPIHGGTRGAPKFPNASYLELLWRGGPASEPRRLMLLTLEQICKGGLRDHIGGGFARYSVDERWLVPHFEKMLYDNAQLLELLALAWRDSGKPLFRQAGIELVEWLQREMLTAGGRAFAASLDADSEGHEGRFYVWDKEEIVSLLQPDDADFVTRSLDIGAEGNWEGHAIPNRLDQPAFSEADEKRWQALRPLLLAARAARIAPTRDDKVLADWNGLMIAALARAGIVFARNDWIDLAAGAFHFVSESMADGEALGHSWREDRLLIPGLASDLAAMIRAALALAEARPQGDYLTKALGWARAMEAAYRDEDGGGYCLTAITAPALIARPRSSLDDATPNQNGVMADNLFRLSAMTGDDLWLQRGDELLKKLSHSILANVFGHASMLNALHLRLYGTQIVILGEDNTSRALHEVALAQPFPNRIVLKVARPEELPDKHPVKSASFAGNGAAFVCNGETCSRPVQDAGLLEQMLKAGNVSRESP